MMSAFGTFFIDYAIVAVVVAIGFGLMARPPSRRVLSRIRFGFVYATAKWTRVK